jgi:hypothetical protein
MKSGGTRFGGARELLPQLKSGFTTENTEDTEKETEWPRILSDKR